MVSLIAVSVIAGLGAALIQVQSMMTKKHEFSIDRRRALYVAEAGLAEAALAVSQGKSGIIADENIPARFGAGVYWVESTDLPGDRLALVCTSRVGRAEFMLRTIVVPNLNPVSSLGFFGTDGVEIGWGTIADGYHSAEGEHTAQIDLGLPVPATTGMVRIGSNDDIYLVETVSAELEDPRESTAAASSTGSGTGGAGTVGTRGSGGSTSGSSGSGSWGGIVPGGSSTGGGSAPPTGSGGGKSSSGGSGSGGAVTALPGDPTWIIGFLRAGPEGSVRSSGFSMLKGRIRPLRYPRPLPSVQVPPTTEVLLSDQSIKGIADEIGTSLETTVMGRIEVSTGAVLTITGPKVLVADELIVHSGGTLNLEDDSGPIDIYLRSGLDLRSGSNVNSRGLEADSRGTTITMSEVPGGARGRVTLEATGEYHGILYAPSDAVTIPASLRWKGSAVARLLRTGPGAHISFDQRLSIGGLSVPTLPRLLSWQIVPLGSGTARQLTVDPLLELALRGVTPTPSALSAPEATLAIDYVDTAGDLASYKGNFAGFNNAGASRIVGVRWDDPRGGMARTWARPAGADPANAIRRSRQIERSLRGSIRALTADPRVGYLSEEETVDLISSLPPTEIALLPADVQAADDRTGRADDTAAGTTAPFDMTAWMDDVTAKDDKGRDLNEVNNNGAVAVDGGVVTGN